MSKFLGIGVLTLWICLSMQLVAAIEKEASPEEALSAFKRAMHDGKAEDAVQWLDAGLKVYENGYVEQSREEYLSGHFNSDAEFTQSTSQQVLTQNSGIKGPQAWITTTTRTIGQFKGKKIDSMGTETILLHKTADKWLIFHIHWSSHKTRSGS